MPTISGFATIGAARQFCGTFFSHYNDHHHHSGIGLHTPHDVHYGLAAAVRDKRQGVLDAAYAAGVRQGGHPVPTARAGTPRRRFV